MTELGENTPGPLEADDRPDWLVEVAETVGLDPVAQRKIVLGTGAAIAALIASLPADVYLNTHFLHSF